ncbi:MAG: serine/threonine-protein phosphatase [Myxococcales bacterium]|nr:serine/threonine-protein phosphatase [Myxococcales bacterium]
MSGARWILRAAGLTDTGQKREANEDAFALHTDEALFVVADGMGGHVAGAEASKLVVDLVSEHWRNKRPDAQPDPPALRDVSAALKQALVDVGEAFRHKASTTPDLNGMGATLVMLLFDGDRIHIAWGGDSRAYRLRRGKLEQLTADHTMVGALLREGAIDPEAAKAHPARNKLVNYVGMRGRPFEPELTACAVALDDRYLLCSDGLTGMVDDTHIAAVLDSGVAAAQACKSLVARANEAGGKDNITAVIIDVVRE